MFNVEKRRMENVYSVSSSVKRAKDSIDVEDETPTTSTSLDSLNAKFAQNIESPPTKESRTEETWDQFNDSPLNKPGGIPEKPTLDKLGNISLDTNLEHNPISGSLLNSTTQNFSPLDGSQKLFDKTISFLKDPTSDNTFGTSNDTLVHNTFDISNGTLGTFETQDGPIERQEHALESTQSEDKTVGRNIQKVTSRLTEKGYRDSLMEAYRNISREVSRDPLYPPLPNLSRRRGRLEMPSAKSTLNPQESLHTRDDGSLGHPYATYTEQPSESTQEAHVEESNVPDSRPNSPHINVHVSEMNMERTPRSNMFRIPVIQDGEPDAPPGTHDKVAIHETLQDGDRDSETEKEPKNGCGHDCLSLPIEDGVLEITSIYDLILDMRFCSLQLPIPNDLTGLREFTLETNESSSITNYDICYDEDLGSNFVMAEPFRFFCKVHITFDNDGEYWCCCYYDARGNYVQKRFNTADIDFNTAQMLANRCRDAAEKTFHSIWILKHKSLLERPIPDGLAESFVHTVNSINECVNNEDCIVCCANKIQRILQDR